MPFGAMVDGLYAIDIVKSLTATIKSSEAPETVPALVTKSPVVWEWVATTELVTSTLKVQLEPVPMR